MKYRPHTGSLSDSMARVVEGPDRAWLFDYLRKDLSAWGYELTPEDIRIEPYCYDDRVGWDTKLVTIRNKPTFAGNWFFGATSKDYFGAGYTDGE